MDRQIDPQRLRCYPLPGGWQVVAGRTDADNEYLSLRFARPAEWWFHAAGCAGSHVLLLEREGQEPDRDTLRAAAAVAAWHSKARNASRVPVSMTQAVNVSKTRGSPRGQVTVRRQRDLKVTPGLPDDSKN